jgi:hypothetical protein
MATRNVERGRRNGTRRALFRVARSPFAVLALAACNPATTRPAFLPYPEAPHVILDGRRDRVTAEAQAWLAGEGLGIEWVSGLDGYLETAWYDTRARRSLPGRGEGGNQLDLVKIRCWADPDAPGKTRLTVEAVYRPILDPSRPERDLEVVVPQGHDGARLAERLLEEMKKKFGS